MILQKKILASALILSIQIFSGCHSSKNDAASGKKIFRYNDATGINSLDPAFAKDQSTIWPCSQLYNGLVQLDENLKVQPCIAREYFIEDGGRKYVFILRKDVWFHQLENFTNQSRTVTARDFVYSLGRLVNPKVASPGAWVMNSVMKNEKGELIGVSARNDSTLEIQLSNPFPAFLSLLCMPYCSVVPHEVVEKYGNDFSAHAVGTGPFQFGQWKENVKLIFYKNPQYFEKKNGMALPLLDAVEISFINDKQSAFIELLKGNIDFISGLDPSFKDEVLTRSGKLKPVYEEKFNLQLQPYLNTEYLMVNMDSKLPFMKNSPLSIPEVRMALNYGFDRKRMMTFLRNNIGTPGESGFIPAALKAEADSALQYGYHYDPVLAAKLLKQCGHEHGKDLGTITLSTTSTYLDLCEYIKTEWEKLGFKILIDVNQAAVHRKMVSEQKLAFYRGSWLGDYPDAENYLALFYSGNHSPKGPNTSHFSNSKFDALYEKSFFITNDSLRQQVYLEMDSQLMRESPVIVLYYDKVFRLIHKNIRGLKSNGMNMLMLKEVDKEMQN